MVERGSGSVKRMFKDEAVEEEEKGKKTVSPPSRYNLLKRAKYSVDDDDGGLTSLYHVIQYASPNGPASVQTLAACSEDEVYRHVFELQCYAFLGVADCADKTRPLSNSSSTHSCPNHEKCELKELVGLTVGFSTQAALLTPRHFERVPTETVRWLVNGHDSMTYEIRQLEPIWVVQRSRVPPTSTRKETQLPCASPLPILTLASPHLPSLQVSASSSSAPFMSPASTTPSRRSLLSQQLPSPSPRLQLLSSSSSCSPSAKVAAAAVTVHIVRHLSTIDPFAPTASSKDDDDEEEEEEELLRRSHKKPSASWTLSIMQPSELAVLEQNKIPFSILLSATGKALREARQQIAFDFRVWKLSHAAQIVRDTQAF